MSPISCSFCTNSNPPEAKFCNQCGSPLGLKPCPSCEAVNEAGALQCHQCGAALLASVADLAPSVNGSTAAEGASVVPEEAAGAEESASVGAERVSPFADEPIVAAPLAVDVAQDAPIHIPESFADRLERDSGSHAFERLEPRIAHSEDRDAPEAVSPYLRSTSMRSRGRAWRAPLALAVLIAIAGAGYYAYQRDVPGLDRLAEFANGDRHSEEPTSAKLRSSESRAAVPPSSPPAADVASKAQQPIEQSASTTSSATTGTDAQSATEANPASAALVSVQPGSPGRPATDAETAAASPATGAKAGARPSLSASRNDDEAARQRSESASRSRRQADADAIATQRLIARDLGTAPAPPANVPAAPLDRDAAATQRLIERDLGPFLQRNDGSSRGGTSPAIH